METLERLISAEEAGKRLGTSARTVRALVKSGELPGVMLGAEYRVDWVALQRWLDRQAAATEKPL
jgi:excisionase family DNA binding protein